MAAGGRSMDFEPPPLISQLIERAVERPKTRAMAYETMPSHIASRNAAAASDPVLPPQPAACSPAAQCNSRPASRTWPGP